MDENLNTIKEIKKKQMKERFKKHNMKLLFFKDAEAIQVFVKEKLQTVESVSVGGSMTLFETGVIDILEKSKVTYYNRYQPGLTTKQIQEVFRKAFSCDVYLTSTNAITEDGYLYNVDGTGNRVAAMIYGPKEVLVIAGENKICQNQEAAKKRVREVAAPVNSVRVKRNNPCIKTGICMDCQSPEKICSAFVTLGYQAIKERITVCIIEGSYGY